MRTSTRIAEIRDTLEKRKRLAAYDASTLKDGGVTKSRSMIRLLNFLKIPHYEYEDLPHLN